MKKARLVIREDIKGIEDDCGLWALDGIYKTPFENFNDNTDEYKVFNVLKNKYKHRYDNLSYSIINIEYAS